MKCPKCGHRRAKTGRCKFCGRIRSRDWKRTKLGLLRQRYHTLKSSSKQRGWPSPNFTLTEFVQQFEKDPVFLKLYAEWVAHEYETWWSPSIDRIDADLPYQRGNLQWKRWEENWTKSQVVDHKQYDCYQITMGNTPPEIPKVNGYSGDFNIRPEYSFDFGAFIMGVKQKDRALLWDTYEEAKKGAKDLDVSTKLVKIAAYWEGDLNHRAVRYVYGLCHPVLGFMSLPF